MATTHVYTRFAKHLALGDINWTSDTFKVSLHTSSYTPNQDTHEAYSDLTNELPTANGYTAGGFTLTTVAGAESGHTFQFDSDDPTWGSANFTFRYMVLRKHNATASLAYLVEYVDYLTDQSPTAGLTLVVDSTGLWVATAS